MKTYLKQALCRTLLISGSRKLTSRPNGCSQEDHVPEFFLLIILDKACHHTLGEPNPNFVLEAYTFSSCSIILCKILIHVCQFCVHLVWHCQDNCKFHVALAKNRIFWQFRIFPLSSTNSRNSLSNAWISILAWVCLNFWYFLTF